VKVIIDMPVFAPALEKLRGDDRLDIHLIDNPAVTSRALPRDLLLDCDVLFCTIPPANHTDARQLKYLQISSAGYGQVIGKKFEEWGIKVCNALGVFDVPIAEWNIAMMINLARDLRQMIRNQDSGVWDKAAKFQTEIRGNVVGIWGYGGIGRETARLCKALGLKVHVLSRSGKLKERENIYRVEGTGDFSGTLPDRVFRQEEKEAFLQSLDFLIMAIPLTPATEGIVGEEEIKLLKPSAYLLNPARGPLINEGALIKALNRGWIAGAAIDTHYQYPLPPEHPLWQMKHVILTPHISGSSESPHFLERVWDIFVRNVENLMEGSPLLNELTSDQLKGL
jgi:phosphoglycerate dehydrogenase-like enzyme